MIGGNHRSTTIDHEITEQPQLRIEVMRHIGMIIHVVAREIGEAAGRDAHAVEAELVEPMRGRFERKMRDAVARDLVELPVQCDRVRRGQRAVDGAFWRNETDGADARGVMAKTLPDLPRESGNRCLAAGARHRRDGVRLLRIKFRRSQRQRAARIFADDEGNARAFQPMVACDSNGTGHNGRIYKTRTVSLAARERKEQIARLHRAAVDGQPPHLDRIARSVDRGVSAKEVAKSHAVPVRRRGVLETHTGNSSGLLICPGCRKNEAVGRRQVEAGFDPQKRRNPGNNSAAGRHRVPA